MQQPDDIAHLYQEFGGQPETYREITRARDAHQARERWPLIAALGDLSAGVPPVHPQESATQPGHAWRAGLMPAPEPVVPPQGGPVEPTGPLPGVVPATPPVAASPVPMPAAAWGAAPAVPVAAPMPSATPAALAPVLSSAPAQPAAVAAHSPASGTLHSPSPLSRLARPPAEPEPEPVGLQQTFARLLRMRNRP
ncbi:cellulose biosynthesis protein BcsP [Pulveribacter sp.]|uniref:cellulose biosynthesis protein BcsP n=1 Tax=Pulveribacter sp. TaxID=2678893 RepID=UPI0028ACB673|nr:cellulose biosynthesis protein BcsP [Pulveribacter sp.]